MTNVDLSRRCNLLKFTAFTTNYRHLLRCRHSWRQSRFIGLLKRKVSPFSPVKIRQNVMLTSKYCTLSMTQSSRQRDIVFMSCSTRWQCFSLILILILSFHLVLADLTNGRAYATVLHLSVVCLSSITYILSQLELNGAPYRKTVRRSK